MHDGAGQTSGRFSPQDERTLRLMSALYCCREGRKLLEEARAAGIQLGNNLNPAQPTALHLSSTAVFMKEGISDLCRQVMPGAREDDILARTSEIGRQLIASANIRIENNPLVSPARQQPAGAPKWISTKMGPAHPHRHTLPNFYSGITSGPPPTFAQPRRASHAIPAP